MLDSDELLVPTGNRTLLQFLNQVLSKESGVDGISFRNVYYWNNASKSLPSTGDNMLGNVQRTQLPSNHGKLTMPLENKFTD